MGRKRTQLQLTDIERASILHHLNTTQDPRQRERLNFALNASTGTHTLKDLAQASGRSLSTLQNWLLKFEHGGLSNLLQRDAAPGKPSPLAGEKLQEALRAGLKRHRWTTAQQIADWLTQEHGIRRSRKSIYYWLDKIGAEVPKL